MARAMLRAYGWDDLADELRPVFLTEVTEDDQTYQGRYFWPAASRNLVLSRLVALHAERHREEVAAGLVSPKRAKQAASEDEEQPDLLGNEN